MVPLNGFDSKISNNCILITMSLFPFLSCFLSFKSKRPMFEKDGVTVVTKKNLEIQVPTTFLNHFLVTNAFAYLLTTQLKTPRDIFWEPAL